MSTLRRTSVIAAVAALTVGSMTVASTTPAEAHTYGKVGSVTAKEANKLFKQTFKQRCLTLHEARHIAHGDGELTDDYSEDDDSTQDLDFPGTAKSHIRYISLTFEDGCAASVYAYYRR